MRRGPGFLFGLSRQLPPTNHQLQGRVLGDAPSLADILQVPLLKGTFDKLILFI